MPLTRLVCYCEKCKGMKDLPVDDALRHAKERESQFPYELLVSMLGTVQDRGTRISTTTIAAKCLRSEVILRTEDYTADPKRMYAAFRGTMFHGQLEKNPRSTAREEPRFHKELLLPTGELVNFSGSPDLVDVAQGKLYDYKFSKENPRYDYPWPDHVAQGQVNRWLCDYADYVQWRDQFWPLTERGADLIIEANGCDDPRVGEWDLSVNRENFTPPDWQGIYVVYMDDRGPKPMLCTKSIDVPKVGGNGTKKARVADIWDDDRVEAYVLDGFVKVDTAFSTMTQGQPPEIAPEFYGWSHPLCEWCAVKDKCITYFIRDATGVQQEARAA